jgi:alkylation response protein AidB-like acyl-CoA dehydrogenase
MLNMPPEHGGTGLDARPGGDRGGSRTGDERARFAVVDRGPRELLELVTPEQAQRFVEPIVRGEYREAWALTEPGAGSTSPA